MLCVVAGAVAFGGLTQTSRIGNWLELRTYDLRFMLRGSRPVSTDPGIVILGIDERSFNEIPEPLALWQDHVARVIESLAVSGASVVGLDLVFPDTTEFDPEGQGSMVRALLEADAVPIPVILGYRVRGQSVDQPPPALAMAAGPESFAYVNLTTDADDFVRRQELYSFDSEGRIAPGFALAIARTVPSSVAAVEQKVAGGKSSILINFGARHPFPVVSFSDALEASIQRDQEFFKRHFSGQIVLIGILGDEDLHSTPLYYFPRTADEAGPRRTSGVEIHGHAISTILNGSELRSVHPAWQWALLAVLVTAISILCFFWTPGLGLAASGILLLLFLLLAVFRFEAGFWILTVGPVSAAVMAAGSSQALNYLLEGKEKRRLRRLFKRYVSDDVIGQLLATPEELVLKGERRVVSVLFSDIRNFTTRSEKVQAEELVADLNLYFERMVAVIHRNKGMVDKFIGDGIMAVFGAPVRTSNSAEDAVRAALGMSAEVKSFNGDLQRRGVEPIEIGIGIHTGEAIIGNIGSPERMEYTAMGDVVNTASRIEGLNKQHGSEILISEETLRKVGAVKAEFVAEQLVKGKSQSIRIYKVTA